jgi:hypothetical protein
MGDEESNETLKNIHWTEMLEEYFASTGEKAHCLSWCHKRSEQIFSTRKTWIDLPVIVISGVTGFLSAGSTSMFPDAKLASISLGVASLFVSVLNTTGSYYGWAKRAEGHRISAIHYARLYRSVTVELSLPRDERMRPNDFLKYVRDQYDRLQEISPLLPTEVITDFQTKFAKETEISKPEEANGLEKITVYRGDENLQTDNPARTPKFKLRTPKFGTPKVGTPKEDTTVHVKNPMLPTALQTMLPAVLPAALTAALPAAMTAAVPALLQTVIQPKEPQPQTQNVPTEVAALTGMAAVAMASEVLDKKEEETSL